MAYFPDAGLNGYNYKTVVYKSTRDGDIKLDIAFPEDIGKSPLTVLLHYHGGFLVVGDRYSFFPYWLVRACASRGWGFVTPDYRLMPESTAQSSLEDAIDAYQWTLSTLPQYLNCQLGPVLVAGSSAGAYLALAMASAVVKQPSALLLMYGMLDATYTRYKTSGTNIFGRPAVDTGPILAKYPKAQSGDVREMVSAYPLPPNMAADPRFSLVSALHLDALFLDYMTGIDGLGRSVKSKGVEAIPESHKQLFPLSFADLSKLPRTMLLHGKNDSAVPVELSLQAAEKLRAVGVEVQLEVPDDAEHGFDARAGNIDVEAIEGERMGGFKSLCNAVAFLHNAASVQA